MLTSFLHADKDEAEGMDPRRAWSWRESRAALLSEISQNHSFYLEMLSVCKALQNADLSLKDKMQNRQIRMQTEQTPAFSDSNVNLAART